MATYSSVLAWRIPGTAEPGGLPSMGSHRVGHDWSDLAATAAADSMLKSRDIALLINAYIVKAIVFPIAMHRCESCTIKKLSTEELMLLNCGLEKALESPLDCKEIQPVHPKWNQPWIFIGRTDVEAETPILGPPDAKNWLTGKDPDAGKDWRREEKGMTEDEMVGWHHWLNGHEFEHGPGVSDG